MLKIRMARIGKKKQPYYRLIITEQARDNYGKTLEILGSYNPRDKVADLKIDRIKHWLENGAKPTETVHNLLVSKAIIKDKKVSVIHIKAKKKKKTNDKAQVASGKKNDEKGEEKKVEEKKEEAASNEQPVTNENAEKPVEKPVEEDKKEEKTEEKSK